MASFNMTFQMDNAAFDGNTACEVERILRDVADMVATGYTNGAVVDVNGNKVGTFKLSGVA
jgi:hypothetical protein